jgi:diguanylate cyclase (GGDEF)-like protein/PAS domain S-box-containing protein
LTKERQYSYLFEQEYSIYWHNGMYRIMVEQLQSDPQNFKNIYKRGALYLLGIINPKKDPVFDNLAKIIFQTLPANGVQIVFYDATSEIIKAEYGEVNRKNHFREITTKIEIDSDIELGELRVYLKDEVKENSELLNLFATQISGILSERYRTWDPTSTSHVGIIAVDEQARILSTSPNLEQIFGWKLEEIFAQSALDKIHPDDLTEALKAFEKTSSDSGQRAPYDMRLKTKSGDWLEAEVRADNRILDPRIKSIVFSVRLKQNRNIQENLFSHQSLVLSKIIRGDSIEDIFKTICEFLEANILDCFAFIRLREGDVCRIKSSSRSHRSYRAKLPDLSIESALITPIKAIRRGQVEILNDLENLPEFKQLLPAGFKSCWAHPIFKAGSDAAAGCIEIYKTDKASPELLDLHLLEDCATLCLTALEHVKVSSELLKQATEDVLTGLPNRSALNNALSISIEFKEENTALIILGLRRLNIINDSLGHSIGNKILIESARRIKEVINEEDFVARFSGDEFAILAKNVDSGISAQQMAEALLRNFDRPFVIRGHELYIGACAGVALSKSAQSPDELIQNADAARMRARELGSGTWVLYDANLRSRAVEKLALQNGLRKALGENEIIVHFQPEFSLAQKFPTGVEALVRWQHPEWGIMPPAKFLPEAEEAGLMQALTERVFELSAVFAKQLKESFPSLNLPVWVNLSASQISRSGVFEWINSMLKNLLVEGNSIGLEITEAAVINDLDTCVNTLKKLRDQDIHLAIDDFGTGYSSLSYLRQLPVEVVKLDRSFVAPLGTNRQHDAVVRAIIELVHTLGMSSLGEGAETQTQIDILSQLSCDQVQGYFFSPPTDGDSLVELLKDYVLNNET